MASISSLFGYILNFIYNIVNNFGVSIIIFSVLLKIVLLPISIKQQKTMKKTAKVQEKVKELQEKYKNDQQKLNQEMMELYKRENISPFSGCLSALIPIIMLIAMFGLVRNPLTYMLKKDNNIVNSVANYMKYEGIQVNQGYPQISVLKYVSQNRGKTIDLSVLKEKKDANQEETENREEEIKQEEIENKENNVSNQEKQEENNEQNLINLDEFYINMEFIGLDLSNIPKDNWDNWTVFIIPALYVLTSMISMKLTTMMTKKNKKNDIIEVKKEENKSDEDKLSPEEMSEQMNKSMTWFMPIMSVSISLIAPLGLALYWLINNILMIAERLILNAFLKSEGEE